VHPTIALGGTRLQWEAYYNRWPMRRRERALVAVADDPEREPIGLRCPVCDGLIEQGGNGPRRIYCSRQCQRAANGRTVEVAA
jgi:hypothetical protein